MNAALLAQIINGAFSVIAAIRRMGLVTDDINTRLDLVDHGGEAITADEVQMKLDDFQSAIDEGRGM